MKLDERNVTPESWWEAPCAVAVVAGLLLCYVCLGGVLVCALLEFARLVL